MFIKKYLKWISTALVLTGILLTNFKDKDGMKYSKYNLEFFGLCKKCR